MFFKSGRFSRCSANGQIPSGLGERIIVHLKKYPRREKTTTTERERKERSGPPFAKTRTATLIDGVTYSHCSAATNPPKSYSPSLLCNVIPIPRLRVHPLKHSRWIPSPIFSAVPHLVPPSHPLAPSNRTVLPPPPSKPPPRLLTTSTPLLSLLFILRPNYTHAHTHSLVLKTPPVLL